MKQKTRNGSLENQAGQLIQEASENMGQNAEAAARVALPLVRRICELAQRLCISSTNELTLKSYLLS